MLDNTQGTASQNTRTRKLHVQHIQNLPGSSNWKESSTNQDTDQQNLIKA